MLKSRPVLAFSASMRRSKPKVLLYDEHLATREGIRKLLATAPIKVIDTAGTISELLEKAAGASADVFIVEPTESGHYTVDVIKRLLERKPNAPVVAYSANEGLPSISAAYFAGTKGFVTKTSPHQLLIDAILAVSAGETYFMPGFGEKLALFHMQLAQGADPRRELSPREFAIFTLLARGQSPTEIANALGLTVRSVQNRSRTITLKLGIKRESFTRHALNYGVISERDLT